jgi:hypothetical protein
MSGQLGQTPPWPPQRPYSQQSSPWQFQRPPNSTYPSRNRGLWGWYKTRTRRMKIGLGCGTIIVVLLFSYVSVQPSEAVTSLQHQPPRLHRVRPHSSEVQQQPIHRYQYSHTIQLLRQLQSQQSLLPMHLFRHKPQNQQLLLVKLPMGTRGVITLSQENSFTTRRQAFAIIFRAFQRFTAQMTQGTGTLLSAMMAVIANQEEKKAHARIMMV